MCASAVAVLASAGHVSTPKVDVADFACQCERFVGTLGGGMDQAIALLARKGVAMHVEFHPVWAARQRTGVEWERSASGRLQH